MSKFRFSTSRLFALGLFGSAQLASAYLGSFEEADGYRTPGVGGVGNIASSYILGDAQFYLDNNFNSGFTGIVAPGAYPNTMGDATHGADLSRYNAGQYGTSGSGPGGTAVDIGDNSGLWRALSGGRLNEDAGAPYYTGGQFQRDYIAAYGYAGARTGDQVLNLLAYDQDLRYAYSLDSRDFNGIAPVTTSDMRVDFSFWTCPTDADDASSGVNTVGMSIKDSLGQSLISVGYTGDNFLQYRVGSSLVWQTTTIQLGTQGWNELQMSIDTNGNTVSLSASAYNDASGILGSTVAITLGESIGFNTDNVTEIEWTATDVDGFKNFFDDFDFALAPVPEPGSAVMLMLAGLGLLRRQRRMQVK
jgi:hypothetical protein